MAKNQNNATATATQRPDIEAFDGASNADAASVLMQLWSRAKSALSDSELAWLAGAGEEVHVGINCSKALLTDIACLSEDMNGLVTPAGVTLSVSNLLWPVVNQLDALAVLAFVSSEAADRLARPSLYREGGLLHHR